MARVLICLSALLTCVPASAQDKPVRALFVLVGSGAHNVETNTPPLLKTIETVGGIKATLLAPPKGKPGDGAHLAKLVEVSRAECDVLVFYTVGNKMDPAMEKAVKTFVDEGGGLVAIHGATASFGNSKVWSELLGGRFAGHAAGTHDLPVEITDPAHPITAGVEKFTINDEEYTFRFTPGVKRTVLAKFQSRPAKTAEKNGNNDILWTVESGKGRIVYCGLGHDTKAWGSLEFQKLILQSIHWAAGKPKVVTITAGK